MAISQQRSEPWWGRITNYAEIIALTVDGNSDVSRGEDIETPSFQGTSPVSLLIFFK
jgi:hypothetical protein